MDSPENEQNHKYLTNEKYLKLLGFEKNEIASGVECYIKNILLWEFRLLFKKEEEKTFLTIERKLVDALDNSNEIFLRQFLVASYDEVIYLLTGFNLI